VPTLLIYGGASQFYAKECAHYVQNAIPGAILHIYEDADHFPQIWQKTQFINHIRAFVESLGQ
jgi:pimeloyl-ACP methyl ester carboxylesterase